MKRYEVLHLPLHLVDCIIYLNRVDDPAILYKKEIVENKRWEEEKHVKGKNVQYITIVFRLIYNFTALSKQYTEPAYCTQQFGSSFLPKDGRLSHP